MIRMKNYLWKNLIVCICIISTLLLQGFSCYAAASGEDTSVVSKDNVSSFYSGNISGRNVSFALEYADAADVESTIAEIDNDNGDIEKENVIAEVESTETESAITEAKNIDTEEVAKAEGFDTEDVIAETENSDTEDAVAEMESSEAMDAETESVSAELENTDFYVLSEEEIVVVESPSISEYGVQPFDYIVDPQRLITATNGIKYGNISFEEGSTLYFRNMEGSYDYSSRSDQLTITSQSTVPVIITLTASLQNYDSISLTNDPAFKGDNRNSLYLALVDDKGNMVPLSESGEVKIVYEMGEISKDEAIEGTGEEQYSFGLMGACNPNGSWEDLAELPQVVVMWKVEPILNNEDTVSDDSVSDNSISMNGVSDNSISMNGVSDNSISMNGVSDNSISMNGVSDNSISMNGVSDNSISMNGVSDNSISMNGVSDNYISENGGILPSGVQNAENYIEETGTDILESAGKVLDNIISENNDNNSDNNGETEDNGNTDVTETESALTEDSVLTDIEDITDTETETAQTNDNSNADAAETVSVAGSNASGDDAGITGSSLSSQAPTEAVSELSDSGVSVLTGITNVEVESGTYY